MVAEGSAYNYVGSSSWIALATVAPILDPDYKTFTFAHLVPGMFMPDGTMQAAGASYQWTRDQLCPGEIDSADGPADQPLRAYERPGHAVAAGRKRAALPPLPDGRTSPHWNPNARGAFVGLTIRHTRSDMIRAVLEGVAMNLRLILEAFQAQGAEVEAMRLIGGGARGRIWNQIMADIYGIPVQRLAILEEATSMGAALAGGIAVGLYPGFSMATEMNPVAEVIDPDPTLRATYAELTEIFKETYRALAPVYERMAGI